LQPAGLRLQPIGLGLAEATALAELVDVPAATVPDQPRSGDRGRRSTIEGAVDWSLMVRLLGPVAVVDRAGAPVEFERSKTRELVAWLATHRDRSTRGNARTALWEQDVRDATFANVVSEARRTMARCVPPPAGAEWVGRTLTDSLPLHARVVSDADLVELALARARLQPPPEAIATLRPVVDLIGGLPFEGTSYLWPDSEGLTSHLILLATTAAAELAAHYLSVGDVEGVFAATGRGLRVLPGHEELIGLRMRAHAGAGDHAGVRQEWESYERMIVADPWSDGEPSPKLIELRRDLLHPSI
jgi:two-component SAPR family response regulator